MTVVTARSNSPIFGAIWCDRLIGIPGATSSHMVATRSSCSALRNAQSRQTAMLSAPSATSSRTDLRNASSFSGVTISPSDPMRSTTPRTMSRGTIGSGGSVWIKSIACDCGRPPTRPIGPRAMAMVSSNPAVNKTPTRAPRRWMSALVDAVVPCAKMSVRDRISLIDVFSALAAHSRTSNTPFSRNSGVENDFSVRMRPLLSIRTRSVNVPPVSTPIFENRIRESGETGGLLFMGHCSGIQGNVAASNLPLSA